MVNVPPRVSSAVSFLARARVARSVTSRASRVSVFSSAALMTGTISPPSASATAMPMLSALRWISPCSVKLTLTPG